MWIMIIRVVPVQEKFRPQFMGIYWGVPWIEAEPTKKTFINWYCQQLSSNGLGLFRDERIELNVRLPIEIFQNICIESTWPEEFKIYFKEFVNAHVFVGMFGLEPNPARAMRVIVNDEAVKIWPHEYSIIKSDNMKDYINEKLYEFRPSSTAEEKLIEFSLDEITKPIYDAAIVTGCTDAEAMLMAMGVDVSENYIIPPIGWYEYIGPTLIENPESFGAGLSPINHERRRLNASKRQCSIQEKI